MYNTNTNLLGTYHTRETEVETEALRRDKPRRSMRFLKGPIPMQEIATAAKLPGQSLAVLLAVHHQTTLTGKSMVTLPSGLLNDLGTNRDAKGRALRLLEEVGLIHVERSKGRAARVGLVSQSGSSGTGRHGCIREMVS
jgi:hypothetical protein